jgi:type I restriction enzyme, S subunit
MELMPGYKYTDVGRIPESWDVISAGEACVKIQDGTHFSPRPGGNQYLYITSKNIRFGHLDVSSASRIDEAQHRSIFKRCDVRKGDLLLTKDGANTGNAALNSLDEQFSLLSSVAFLRFDEKKHSAAYFLQQILTPDGQRRMQDVMAGNAITRLTLDKIKRLRFPIPPTKAEQVAISKALSDLDDLLESLEQLIAKKRHIKQGAMQELLRPKDEWIRKNLGELASIQRGASPRPIESPIWFDENSSIGWVRISDVTGSGMFLRETTQRLSSLGVKNSRPVNRGSLIMSICATVGRPIITEIESCIHDGFVVFDSLRLNKYFLYYLLKSIESDWARHGQTGSQMNLNTAMINRTEVATPKTERQQEEITEVLFSMDAEIAALKAKLDKARQIKQGMMHNLLTGKIRLV